MKIADTEKTRNYVHQLIEGMNINNYPIEPISIIKRHFIPILTYKEAESIGHGEAAETAKRNMIDAFCIKAGAKAVIYYDDEIYWPRVRFSLMHELAHHLLDHHKGKDGVLYRHLRLSPRDWREREADEFAAEMLAPLPLLSLLYEDGSMGEPSAFIISNAFHISTQCAEVIVSKLKKFTCLN